MSQVIKTYLGIFMLLVIAFASMAVIQMHLSVVRAQDFHSAVLTELSNSHFAPEVVKGCEEQAVANGYVLQLHPYEREINGKREIYSMEVVLDYPFQMGMFQIDAKEQIRGVTR